jgi:RNA polymerase sigma factor for flagellar operon FliA
MDRWGERVTTFVEDCSADGDLEMFSALVGSLGVGFIVEDAWDRDAEDASSAAERAEVTGRVLAAVGQLPERQRELLRHHYFLHRPFADLVVEWRVSKGRISQLHTEALMRLKGALADFS